MRHYWEVLFDVNYFPFWEFTMLWVLFFIVDVIIRLHRIERKLDDK